MKRVLISCLAVAALSLTAHGQKVEVQKPDRQQILHVQTALNHLTILELNESVSTVAVGSPVFRVEWRENKVFIEPREGNVATNLFVWTASSRFNYELDPAGPVPGMHFAIDLPAPDPPIKPSAEPISIRKDLSPAEVLVASRPVRVTGSIQEKNRVAVYLRNLLEQDGKFLIQYSIRNQTKDVYTAEIPHVVALNRPRYYQSLYSLTDCQLGSNEAARIKSSGQTALNVENGQTSPSRIAPGQEAIGIIALNLPPGHTRPTVLRVVFPGLGPTPVTATLVF
jgi:hypothetical protein